MSLLSELKRRGVFQAAVAYTLVAWLLVQVADIVLPAFDMPAWVMKALILLLLAGFPISLVLAWIYDLTNQGVRRTDAPEPGSSDSSAFPGQTLNYVIISLLAAAVVLFALDKFYWKTELGAGPAANGASIAVLPFTNLSGDTTNEPFAAGIHDDLLTQLSKISSLRTLSRTSVLQYENTELPIRQIASDLGVDTVLEGGVQRSADRIRVNAQLIDGKTDTHLWAETYDRQLTAASIFAIQSDIAMSIAAALRTTLTDSEQQQLAEVPTRSLAAYEAYALGRSTMNESSEADYRNSLQQFRLATELDPEFAAAWAGLCMTNLGLYTRDSDTTHFEAAEAACTRAAELDDRRVEVHVALGTLYRYRGQYSKAEVALQQAHYAKAQQALQNAMTLPGNDVDAKLELGQVLARQGRFEEAESLILEAEQQEPGRWDVQTSLFSLYYTFSDQPGRYEQAVAHAARSAALRPDLAASWNNLGAANYMLGRFGLAADAWQESLQIEPNRTAYTNTGLAFYYDGRFEPAADMQRKAAELAPNDHRARGRLGDALRLMGGHDGAAREAYESALRLAEEQLRVNDRDWRTLGAQAFYLAQLGRYDAALATIERALQWSDRNAESLYNLALVHMAAGHHEDALDALELSVATDPGWRRLISIDPDFRPLANEDRFQALVSDRDRANSDA